MGFWSSLFGKPTAPSTQAVHQTSVASQTTRAAESADPVLPKRPQGEWASPVDADGENFLANSLMAVGNLKGAIIAHEACYAHNPNHPDILFNLTSAYRRAGRFDDAERFANKLLKRDPTDDDALYAIERIRNKDQSGADEWEDQRRAFDARAITAADEVYIAWPGIVVVEREVPLAHLNERPPKFNISTCDGNGKCFYDVTLLITLKNGKTCKFRLHRTIPELRTLARLSNKERTRQVGEKLHEVGGFALMLGVGEILNIIDRDARIFCDRMAFPGVGPWQS